MGSISTFAECEDRTFGKSDDGTFDKIDDVTFDKSAHLWCHFTLDNVEGQTLDGFIPLLLPAGKYKFPDVEKVEAQDGSWIQEWIEEAGLPSEDQSEEEHAQFARDMATMCAYFLPGLEPGTDPMKIYMWIMTLSFLGDDVLEGRDLLGRDKVAGQEMVVVVADIFRGKYSKFEDIPISEDAFGLKSMIKAGFLAAQKANAHLPNFFETSAHLADAISAAYSGMLAMELEDHYDDDMGDLPVDSYQFFRKYEGGFEGLIELALLCKGAVPTPDMRRSLIFQRILDLTWSINVNINDLFSIRKELNTGVGYNVVAYKSKFVELPKAFAEVVAHVQEQILNLSALTKRYRELGEGNKTIHAVLDVLEQMVDGHVYWYAVSKRYGDIKLQIVQR